MTKNTVPSIPRVSRINSVAAAKREISRIYREVRAGNLEVDEAKKLVDVLGAITTALSSSGNKGQKSKELIAAPGL